MTRTETAPTDRTRSTRDRLVDTALELFERDGFERTPVSRIAARAGVTQMTFFRYFGSKEAVVVDDPFDPMLAQAVAAEPSRRPEVLRIAAAIRHLWAEFPAETDARTATTVRIIARSPMLRAASWRATERTRDAIADALIADGAEATRARIASAACLAALHTALLDWADRDVTGSISAALLCALDVVAAGAEP